ncbi:hypothetical protein KY289_009511 [Solanum tuberosum]|nr:hypothetical protein KY289_009511 [Solanum tuberosum]
MLLCATVNLLSLSFRGDEIPQLDDLALSAMGFFFMLELLKLSAVWVVFRATHHVKKTQTYQENDQSVLTMDPEQGQRIVFWWKACKSSWQQFSFSKRHCFSPGTKKLRHTFHRLFREVHGISNWPHDKEAIALRVGYVKPEIISWKPRIVLFHNFLSAEECDYLRSIAIPRLHVSTVVDAKTGKGIKSDVRTSSGMFLNPGERNYPMIQAIEKRISVYSQIPVENGELIQVLRYEKNQFYRAHHDYFSDSFNVKRGGQRIATMLMYLSDNVEGGETYFPMVITHE